MLEFYKKLRTSVLLNYNSASYEDRFFILTLASLVVFSFLSFLSNVLLGFYNIFNISVLTVSILSSICLYLSLFKKMVRYFKIPMQVALSLLLIASWFSFQGVEGSTTQFVPIMMVVAIYLYNSRYSFIVILFYLLVAVGLLWTSWKYPQLLTHYATKDEQNLDIMATFLLNLIAIGFVVYVLKRNYDKERHIVILQKQELECYNEEINLKNEQILIQNELLESKNKELIASNRTKDMFFSIIGHDLKNPIGVVIGFSELLRNNIDTYDKEKMLRYVGHIEDSSRQIYLLLENLLAWANCQSGQINYAPQNNDITALIKRSILHIRELALKKDIEVTLRCADGVKAFCDANMIELIVRNLVSNAIKYTPSKGLIKITVVQELGRIRLEIRDTGIGIDKMLVNKLLQPGIHASTAGTNNETGTGLGLSLCQEFLALHKSSLQINSEIGSGSCFSFELTCLL